MSRGCASRAPQPAENVLAAQKDGNDVASLRVTLLRHSDKGTSSVIYALWIDGRASPHVALLIRNVGQSNHALANQIITHETQPWAGAGEEWRAMTEHEGADIKSILINKTKVGKASRQVWSGEVNLSHEPRLDLPQHGPDVIPDQRGVGADCFQRARHNPLWQVSPRRGEVKIPRVPIGLVFVPITHDLVRAATIHTAA